MHHIDQIIQLLNQDPHLPTISKGSLKFKDFRLLSVSGSPCAGPSQTRRISDQERAANAQGAVVPSWTQARTATVTKGGRMQAVPLLIHRLEILIHLFQ